MRVKWIGRRRRVGGLRADWVREWGGLSLPNIIFWKRRERCHGRHRAVFQMIILGTWEARVGRQAALLYRSPPHFPETNGGEI